MNALKHHFKSLSILKSNVNLASSEQEKNWNSQISTWVFSTCASESKQDTAEEPILMTFSANCSQVNDVNSCSMHPESYIVVSTWIWNPLTVTQGNSRFWAFIYSIAQRNLKGLICMCMVKQRQVNRYIYAVKISFKWHFPAT